MNAIRQYFLPRPLRLDQMQKRGTEELLLLFFFTYNGTSSNLNFDSLYSLFYHCFRNKKNFLLIIEKLSSILSSLFEDETVQIYHGWISVIYLIDIVKKSLEYFIDNLDRQSRGFLIYFTKNKKIYMGYCWKLTWTLTNSTSLLPAEWILGS